MTLLKDSANKARIQGLSVSLWNDLQDCDENYAESFLEWCREKITINKQHLEEQRIKSELKKESDEQAKTKLQGRLRIIKHKDHPLHIKRGDIVHVTYGLNVGDEFSDLDANLQRGPGHYGIILAQKGFMFLILPLSSERQRLNDTNLEVFFENLGLPGGIRKSHLAFAKMKFVHFRRIKRIHGISGGKITLTEAQMSFLNEKLRALLCLE